MRYQMAESTYLVASFPTGKTVTITIYKLSDSSIIVNAAAMTEVGSTGMYKYLASLAPAAATEYLWLATDGYDQRAGKIVLGGYPDTLATSQAAEEADISTILGVITGGGLTEKTYTLTDAGTGLPLAGVQVWATTDEAGEHQVDITRTTNDAGQVTFRFNLPAGTPIYIWNRYMAEGDAPDEEEV